MFKYGFTHNGTFHTDDICSAALLKVLFPGIEIKRISAETLDNMEITDDMIIFDMAFSDEEKNVRYFGKQLFDHHKLTAGERNGVGYASFGMIWKHFANQLEIKGEKLTNRNIADFDTTVVQPLDREDLTTIKKSPFSILLTSTNFLCQKGLMDSDVAFDNSVNVVYDMFMAEIRHMIISNKIKANISNIVKEKEETLNKIPILIIPEYMPYSVRDFAAPVQFLIYEDKERKCWVAQSLKPVQTGRIILQNETTGTLYIRPDRRFATYDTKEHAFEACYAFYNEFKENAKNKRKRIHSTKIKSKKK